MSVDKMSVDKMSVDKMSEDKMSEDKMSWCYTDRHFNPNPTFRDKVQRCTKRVCCLFNAFKQIL